MTALLDGVRVLDLSRLLPGPYATMLLADLGATVTKVEDREAGDYARIAPPMAPDGQGASYHYLNRGKRSIAIDLKKPEGVALLKRLVRDADILVETFRPRVMDRLGVGYEVLRAENPRLVYCSISGYGWTGPDVHRAGHDNNYLARAGVLGVNGERGRKPALPGIQVADVAAGSLFAVIAMLAALNRARGSGEGAFIDSSMTDGAFALLGPHLANFGVDRVVPGTGDQILSGKICAYKLYETADGRHVSLGALEPKFWRAFIRAVQRPDLAGAAFSEARDGEKPYEDMKALFRSRTLAEWNALLGPADCCAEPVATLADVAADPLFAARGLWTEFDVGNTTLRTPRSPFVVDGAPVPAAPGPAARRGEHTDDILRDAGLEDDAIRRLREGGVV